MIQKSGPARKEETLRQQTSRRVNKNSTVMCKLINKIIFGNHNFHQNTTATTIIVYTVKLLLQSGSFVRAGHVTSTWQRP